MHDQNTSTLNLGCLLLHAECYCNWRLKVGADPHLLTQILLRRPKRSEFPKSPPPRVPEQSAAAFWRREAFTTHPACHGLRPSQRTRMGFGPRDSVALRCVPRIARLQDTLGISRTQHDLVAEKDTNILHMRLFVCLHACSYVCLCGCVYACACACACASVHVMRTSMPELSPPRPT